MRTPTPYFHALAALLLFGMVLSIATESAAEATGGATLVIRVTGLRSDSGKVHVILFDRAKGYPTRPGKSTRKAVGSISGGVSIVTFKGLSPGTYAASALHDEDSDGRMKTNFIGMPKEGIGASNDARGVMGPPSFEAACVEVSAPRTTIGIKMRYL